jgi:hypothetical protein
MFSEYKFLRRWDLSDLDEYEEHLAAQRRGRHAAMARVTRRVAAKVPGRQPGFSPKQEDIESA